MKIIQKLCEMIDEEIHDADKYIVFASEVKDQYPQLAEIAYKLSLGEVDHMKLLHQEVTNLIAAYRKEHGEPPEGMLFVYNYLHEKSMEKAAQVKAKQTLYKE